MGARFYAPDLGIWTVGDPIAITNPERSATAQFGTANPYAYANLNPTTATDPDGEFWHIAIGAGIGALVGGGVEAARQYYASGRIEDWGRVGAAASGGAVSGAIQAALPGVGTVAVMAVGGASSATGGLTERLIASGGGDAGTLSDVVIDVAVGAATAGAVRGASAALRRTVTARPAAAQIRALDSEGAFRSQYGALGRGGGGLLSRSEAAGGHLIDRHVGKTTTELAARLSSNGKISAASTFNSLAEAESGVATALESRAASVADWVAAGANGRLKISAPFSGGSVLKRGAENPTIGTGVRVLLQGNGGGNWHVLTGFPE